MEALIIFQFTKDSGPIHTVPKNTCTLYSKNPGNSNLLTVLRFVALGVGNYRSPDSFKEVMCFKSMVDVLGVNLPSAFVSPAR